jgi:cyclase
VEIVPESVSSNVIANIGGLGFGNVGAIIQDTYAIVIDSSLYPKTGMAFRNYVESTYAVPVKYLILTHYHGDHTFGMQSYKDVEVISSQRTRDHIKRGYHDGWREDLEENDPNADGKIEVVLPSTCFQDKFIIDEGDQRVEIYHSGGHTSDSSYIYYPREKILFTGDLIFANTFPFGADPNCNPDIWIKQLEKISKMDLNYIIPGHGPVLRNNSKVISLLEFLKYLRQLVLEGIQSGTEPVLGEIPTEFIDASERRGPITLETWTEFYQM